MSCAVPWDIFADSQDLRTYDLLKRRSSGGPLALVSEQGIGMKIADFKELNSFIESIKEF